LPVTSDSMTPTTIIISTEVAVHDILTCTVNFGNMSTLAD